MGAHEALVTSYALRTGLILTWDLETRTLVEGAAALLMKTFLALKVFGALGLLCLREKFVVFVVVNCYLCLALFALLN